MLYQGQPHLIQSQKNEELGKHCARRLREHYGFDDDYEVILRRKPDEGDGASNTPGIVDASTSF